MPLLIQPVDPGPAGEGGRHPAVVLALTDVRQPRTLVFTDRRLCRLLSDRDLHAPGFVCNAPTLAYL